MSSVAGLGGRVSVRLGLEEGVPVLDEDLHHHVGKLDVHDGRHSLLLRPKQSWTKTNPEVGHCHQVLVSLSRDL